MCMIPICMIEKRQSIGWKVIDRIKKTGKIITPFMSTEMEADKIYFADGTEEYGIYVFLNKIVAKKFLGTVTKVSSRDTLLVKVEIGNNIWKGKVDSGFPTFANQNYHFYTTDSIKILSIEE